MSYISKLFYDEVRDKKRTAIGVHSRKGKRGYVGKVLYTSDVLSGKEKREYRKNGKVVSWNMYEDIMDYNTFESMPEERQKKVLGELRKKYKNDDIRQRCKLSNSKYYSIVSDLGLKSNKYINNKSANINERVFSDKQLEKAAVDLITYERFKNLSDPEKHYLLHRYTDQLTQAELAVLWGVKVSTVYGMKYTLKKRLDENKFKPIRDLALNIEKPSYQAKIEMISEQKKNELAQENIEALNEKLRNSANPEIERVNNEEKGNGKPENETSSNNQATNEANQIEVPSHDDTNVNIATKEIAATVEEETNKPIKEETTKPNRNYGTTLSFSGEFNKKQLQKKLLNIVELLEDDDHFYKMELSFTEIEEEGETE